MVKKKNSPVIRRHNTVKGPQIKVFRNNRNSWVTFIKKKEKKSIRLKLKK